MSRILVAALSSAAVGAMAWLLIFVTGRLVLSPLAPVSELVSGVATLIAPIAGGLAGGLFTRNLRAAVGSVAGFVIPVLALGFWFGDQVGQAAAVMAVMFAMLTTIGHVAGVAIRPARRTA